MASIKAKLSSVELYTSQCGDDYSTILNIANDVLSRAEKLYIIVQEELEKISRQVNRVQRSYDDIEHKVNSYMQRMEDAADEIDRCSEEIDYIYNHPSTVTTTDEEGNETTEEVIDYDGIRAAERERDAARSTYNLYENKCDEARMVLREAGYTVSKFQNTKYGIEAVSRSIQNDIYEIKKYIRAIEDEAEFNIHSLQGVIDSLQSYLASKAIFMPEGSYYEEFASAGVGGSSFSKSQSNSIGGEPKSSEAEFNGSSETSDVTLNNVSLGLDDLNDVSEGIESLPDKSELALYREVHSAKDYSERKYQKQSQKAVEGLGWESKKAFDEYSGDGHRIMNQYLRGKNPEFVSQNQKEITEQYIGSMVNAINERTLPHTMKLYRGVSTPGDFLQDSNWKDKSLEQLRSEYIGKVAVDDGFCSTSISRESAEDFKRTWDGAMVEITAPKGANAMFMQHVSIYGHEKEVLLQKGSGFKITDIDYNPRTGYIIKAELIGRR